MGCKINVQVYSKNSSDSIDGKSNINISEHL